MTKEEAIMYLGRYIEGDTDAEIGFRLLLKPYRWV